MNTNRRRLILWTLNALGAFVGAWALAAPRGFYDAFPTPGLFGAWVGVDGPYNEHLVRDVGSLYLALVAAGVVAALMRRADASVAVGAAWLVFSVPHFMYHVGHLQGLAPLDAVAQPVALAATLVLAVPLCLPPKRQADAERTAGAEATERTERTPRIEGEEHR